MQTKFCPSYFRQARNKPSETIKSMNETLINQLKTKGCRFASLTYKSKGSGEIAVHTLLLGVNLKNAYIRDVEKLKEILPTLSGVDKIACEEILKSKLESLKKGIGNNSAYTQKGIWKNVCPGIREREDKTIQIYGFSIRKKVIVKGEHKKVNSSEKTLAKKKLNKLLRSSRFRPFVFEKETEFELKANKLETIA